MSDAQRKLDKYAREEKLRNLKPIFFLLLFITFLGAVIYYINRGEWTSSEIEVVMREIVVIEDDTRIRYRVLFEKNDGVLVQVTIPQSSHFKRGGKAIIMESVNSDSRKKRYRYLYPSTDT